MDVDVLYRGVPLLSLALVLFGFALIEALRTRWRDWDTMTATIVFAGVAGALYLGSVGLRYSPLGVEWRGWYYQGVRLSLWLTILGLPSIYRNVGRAWIARRAGQYRCRACAGTCRARGEAQ